MVALATGVCAAFIFATRPTETDVALAEMKQVRDEMKQVRDDMKLTGDKIERLLDRFENLILTRSIHQEVHVEDGRNELAREVLIKQGKINP